MLKNIIVLIFLVGIYMIIIFCEFLSYRLQRFFLRKDNHIKAWNGGETGRKDARTNSRLINASTTMAESAEAPQP